MSLERLVGNSERAGVRRFCLVASARTDLHDRVPLANEKRRLEELLVRSPMEHVILRFPPFMEVWLALVGSSLPLRGEAHATVGRPSPFLRSFRRLTGSLVEDRGLMLVPGSPRERNAFIAQGDAARACAEALERPQTAGSDVQVGGPEVLSWENVAAIYGEVLGRRVRIVSTPAGVYAAAAAALRRFAPVPSATMALNRLVAVTEMPWPPGGDGLVDPATMTTVRQFLEHEASLPAELPRVA